MKLPIITGLVLIALAALFAACGDDDATTDPTGTGGVAATATAPTRTGDGDDATGTGEPTDGDDGGDDGNGNGGGGDPEYQEYFEDLGARFAFSREDTDDATDTLNADLEAAEGLVEEKQAIDDFLVTMIGVFDDSILTMNGFDPPSEAEADHFEFRDNIVEARAISLVLQDDLAAATTSEQAQAILDDFDADVTVLVDQAQAACRNLQELADEKETGVDLECRDA